MRHPVLGKPRHPYPFRLLSQTAVAAPRPSAAAHPRGRAQHGSRATVPPSPAAGAQRSGGSSAGAMLFPSPVCSARSCGAALLTTSLASRRATLSPQAVTAAGHPSRPRPHPRRCLLRCRRPLPQYGRRRPPRRPCVVASSSALSAAPLGTSPCPWRVASSSPLRPDLVTG